MALNDLPIVGPVGTAIFGDPREERLQREMRNASKAYEAYRPEMEAAHMRSLQQQLGAYQPLNSLIGAMGGEGAMIDMEALGQNPLHPPQMHTPGLNPPPPPQGGAQGAFQNPNPWPPPIVQQRPQPQGLPGVQQGPAPQGLPGTGRRY